MQIRLLKVQIWSANDAEAFWEKKGGTNHGKGGSNAHCLIATTGNLGSNGTCGGGYATIASWAALTGSNEKKSAVCECANAGERSTKRGEFS